MLCFAMLCFRFDFSLLCSAMLCYALLCYALLCCALLCFALTDSPVTGDPKRVTLGRRHPMRRGLGLGANRGNQPSAPSYRVKESPEGHIGEALRGVSSTAPPPTQGLLGGDHLSVVAGHSFRPLRLLAFCSRSVALGGLSDSCRFVRGPGRFFPLHAEFAR